MRKKLSLMLALILVLILFLPKGASADSGLFYDTQNYLGVSFDIKQKEGEINGPFSYGVNIVNYSKYNIVLSYMFDSFGNDISLYDTLSEKGKEDLNPGESIRITVSGVIPENIKWQKEGNEFYADLYAKIDFVVNNRSDDASDYGTTLVNDIEKIKLTNIHDGDHMLKLEIDDRYNEMFFTDDGYTMNWELNSQKTNVFGETYSPVTVTNICDKPVTFIFDGLYRIYSNSEMTLKQSESVDLILHSTRLLSSDKKRPKGSKAYFKVLVKEGNQYYGVQSSRIYRNVFFDQENDIQLDVALFEGIYQSEEPGLNNYLITCKNLNDTPVNNLYIYIYNAEEHYKDRKNERTYQSYSFDSNETLEFYYTAPEEEMVFIHLGCDFFGGKVSSILGKYNPNTGELEVSRYMSEFFYNELQKRNNEENTVYEYLSDLHEGIWVENIEVENTPEPSAPPTPAEEIIEQPEPTRSPVATVQVEEEMDRSSWSGIPTLIWIIMLILAASLAVTIMFLRKNAKPVNHPSDKNRTDVKDKRPE